MVMLVAFDVLLPLSLYASQQQVLPTAQTHYSMLFTHAGMRKY